MQIIETNLGEITSKIWNTTLGLRLTPMVHDVSMEGRREIVIGCVQFTGAWEGALSLVCPLSLARKAAKVIFEADSLSTTIRQTEEAIGELINIAGGNLKSLLPSSVQMGLPLVAIGDYLTLVLPGEQVVSRVVLEHEGQPLEIRLMKRK